MAEEARTLYPITFDTETRRLVYTRGFGFTEPTDPTVADLAALEAEIAKAPEIPDDPPGGARGTPAKS